MPSIPLINQNAKGAPEWIPELNPNPTNLDQDLAHGHGQDQNQNQNRNYNQTRGPQHIGDSQVKRRHQKGQGLIEYIILVALIAIASIGVMRVLGQTASIQLANITHSLQGGAQARKIANPQVSETVYSKKDLSDFMKNATKDGRTKK